MVSRFWVLRLKRPLKTRTDEYRNPNHQGDIPTTVRDIHIENHQYKTSNTLTHQSTSSGVDDIKNPIPLKPTIRPFKRKDLSGVVSIERRSFTNPWSPNMFEALYQINPEGFYVAAIDEDIVGYAIVLTEQSLRHWSRKRTAHLMNLAVHPSHRNRGIGKELIRTIIADAKKAEVKEIYLEVRASNTTAITFYKRLGFSWKGVINRFYGDEDAIVMAREIL